MNQNLVAGLGNLYADEALFEAGVHPLAQPGRVSSAKAHQLYKAVRRVLDRAVRLGGTTFSDYLASRAGRAHSSASWCAPRTGKPCRRCGHTIRRIVVGGRSSHFCARCQPRPALPPNARAAEIASAIRRIIVGRGVLRKSRSLSAWFTAQPSSCRPREQGQPNPRPHRQTRRATLRNSSPHASAARLHSSTTCASFAMALAEGRRARRPVIARWIRRPPFSERRRGWHVD